MFLEEGTPSFNEQISQVKLLELDEDGTEVSVDTNGEHMTREHTNVEAEITLYALVGSPSPGTMRVNDKIKELGKISLIDSGNTHNFLDLYVVMSLKLSMDTSSVLSMPCGYDHLEQRRMLFTCVDRAEWK